MEQIVDLIEGIFPGPRGAQGMRGEQGLAGVNAVPADEAVADWIGKVSATSTALKKFHWKQGVRVDVRAYGAVGDGETDDTAAIRACIEQNAGNTIVFPTGTWLVTSTITVPEHTTIHGVGDDSVIVFNPTDDPQFTACFWITDGGDVTIRDIGFRSDQDLQHLRYLLRTEGTLCHDIVIDSVHAFTHCILWAGDYGQPSDVHNHRYIVHACRADNWKQLHVPDKPITTAVVELYNVDDFVVDSCIFLNTSYAGCGIQWWGGPQSMDDYTATGGRWCHHGVVSNNIVRHTQWSPIWGSHGADMVIANNVMDDCSDVCLSIEAASNMVIVGNRLSDSNNGLVSFANSLRHVVFANNVCTQSGEVGRPSEDNPSPRQRFRMFIRWGCYARADISDTNVLDIVGNSIVYEGAVSADNEYNCGIMELGGFAGRINFRNNTVVNTGLNLFTRWLTGEWGLGQQNGSLWPGQWDVSDNHFEWDDIDARLANGVMRDSAVYCSNPFRGIGTIRGNTIRTRVPAANSIPITCYHLYMYRKEYKELWDQQTNANKGEFLITDNRFEGFAHAIGVQNAVSNAEISCNILCARNHYNAPQSLDVVDLTGGRGAAMILEANTMSVRGDNGQTTWMSAWPNELPDAATDKLLAVGTVIEPRGGIWSGSYAYRGAMKKSNGWHYYGQFKPQE